MRQNLFINFKKLNKDELEILKDLKFTKIDFIVTVFSVLIVIAYLALVNILKSVNLIALCESKLILIFILITCMLLIYSIKIYYESLRISFIRLHYKLVFNSGYQKFLNTYRYIYDIPLEFCERLNKIINRYYYPGGFYYHFLNQRRAIINSLMILVLSISFDVWLNNYTLYYLFSALQFVSIYFFFVKLNNFYILGEHAITRLENEKIIAMLIYDKKLTLDEFLNDTTLFLYRWLHQWWSKEEHEAWLELFKPFYRKVLLFQNLPDQTELICLPDNISLQEKYLRPKYEQICLDLNLEKFLGLMEGPIGQLLEIYIEKYKEGKYNEFEYDIQSDLEYIDQEECNTSAELFIYEMDQELIELYYHYQELKQYCKQFQ